MLYLKKVEMYGFKSFADKVELKFDQPVTGIVGPNGCGKSNISDSIRWVLGEQSTKSLRGKSMQDLIFNGTDMRKSMSYCEVSLYIDNTTRIFPLQLDEIIISRKLYRNNESEYLLNRNVVRLRDIQDLIRSVGLGKEGYSIVGQGRMDAILNARPEDRRAIFEEALGISRFRVKKDETERKLEKTRINMDSLHVLSNELEHQLDPLRKQAVSARKYISYYDELRYNEINAYIYSYDNASQNKENSRKKLEGLREAFALRESEFADINDKHDELFRRRNSIDAEMSELRDRQVDLAVDIEKHAGDNKLIQERISSCQKDIETTNGLIAESKAEKQRLEEAIVSLKESNEHRNEEYQTLENELLVLSDKYSGVCSRLDELNSSSELLRKQLESVMSQVTDVTSQKASLLAEEKTLKERLTIVNDSEIELSTKLTASKGEEGNLLQHYDSVKKQREETEKTAEELKKQIKQLEYDQFQLGKELQQKQQAYSGEKGGIDMLRDFANNYKGYQSSVQNIMRDAQQDKELSSRICGVVANLLKVEPSLQTAIEAALGGRLQNIVTENEEDTKYLIDYLRQNDYGRVTFLPVSSMKPHGIDGVGVLKESGVVGIAKDLVSFDKHYNSVFESLLGGILVVDTYENAVAISRKYRYAYRMVTLDGERISDDGSIEGGRKRSIDNLLSYESQITERTKRLEELKQSLNAVESKKNEGDKLLAELRAMQNRLADELTAVNVSVVAAKERIESSNALNNSDKQTFLSLSDEKERIVNRLSAISNTLKDIEVKSVQLDESEKKLREKINVMKDTLSAENTAKDGQQEMLTAKKYNLAVLKNNIQTAEKSIQENLLSIKSLEDGIASRQNYIAQVKSAIDSLYELLNNDTEDSQKRVSMEELKEKIHSTDTLKADIEKQYNEIVDLRMKVSAEMESLRGAVDKEEYIYNKIDDDLAELQQRVLDEYDVTYSAAMQYKDDNFDIEKSRTRISELKLAIARLGAVNVNAIQELENTEARYGDISKQLEDLEKAEADLKNVLKELTVEIESRFEDGMTKINENFKVVFRELFNGGNARLYIDVDENKAPLDYGVEIEAQPPGKKLQNISLLSGGERTMTAAAILFSILKYQPMPFCVLDEVEAALDDSNAERIAKYIRKFSDSTQFVVITHKKPTMENADVLYGVTMEEKGVSKIVSVKLTDAVKQAM